MNWDRIEGNWKQAKGKIKDLDTPLGKFSFRPNRDAQHEPSVQQVKDGKFVRVDPVEPGAPA